VTLKTAREMMQRFEETTLSRICQKYLDEVASLNPQVRKQSLSGLRKNAYYLPELARMANDPHPAVRSELATYFGEVGSIADFENVSPLLEDPDERVRAAAVQGLWVLSDPETDWKVFLQDPAPAVRLAALHVLQEELESDELTQLAGDLNPKVAEKARAILVERTQDPATLQQLFSQALSSALKTKILSRLILFDFPVALAHLKEILDDPTLEPRFRIQVARLLPQIPFEQARELLNLQVENRKDPVLLPSLIPLYVRFNEESPARAISHLQSLCHHEDLSIRVAALKGIGSFEEPSTVDLFRDALEERDENLRATALEILSRMLDYSLSPLLESLLQDPGKKVRKAAIKAIGRLKLEETYPLVAQTLTQNKEDDGVRKVCLQLAGRLKIPEAIPSIQRLLLDELEDFSLRTQAGYALLRISPEALLQVLGAS